MKTKKIILVVVLIYQCCIFKTFSQGTPPLVYYSFNSLATDYPPSSTSICNTCSLNVTGNIAWQNTGSYLGPSGGYLFFNQPNAEPTVNLPTVTTPIDAITVEMFVNFGYYFDVHRRPRFFSILNNANNLKAIASIEYPYITLVHRNGGLNFPPTLKVSLDGMGAKNFDHYFDNLWHHFAFVIEVNPTLQNEKLQIYIDGVMQSSDFELVLPYNATNYAHIINDATNSFRISSANTSPFDELFGGVDEVSLFYEALSPQRIYSDYQDGVNHLQYSLSQVSPPIPASQLTGNYDQSEFPINYTPVSGGSDYSTVATSLSQLREFPLPRFKNGHTLRRNVSLFRTPYSVANEYGGNQADQIGASVNIQLELARNWNYYFNVIENINRSGSVNNLSDPTTDYEAAWVQAANNNPDVKLSALLLPGPPGSVDPCNLNDTYISAGNLDACYPSTPHTKHYIYNSSGTPNRARSNSIQWSTLSSELHDYDPDGIGVSERFDTIFGISGSPNYFLQSSSK